MNHLNQWKCDLLFKILFEFYSAIISNMKSSPLYLNSFLPFNLFLLFSLIMNDLSRGDGTKKSLVSASEDTEGDIEIIIQEDSAIHNKDENAYQSK